MRDNGIPTQEEFARIEAEFKKMMHLKTLLERGESEDRIDYIRQECEKVDRMLVAMISVAYSVESSDDKEIVECDVSDMVSTNMEVCS